MCFPFDWCSKLSKCLAMPLVLTLYFLASNLLIEYMNIPKNQMTVHSSQLGTTFNVNTINIASTKKLASVYIQGYRSISTILQQILLPGITKISGTVYDNYGKESYLLDDLPITYLKCSSYCHGDWVLSCCFLSPLEIVFGRDFNYKHNSWTNDNIKPRSYAIQLPTET